MPKKHDDNKTSLHPRTFREALKELVDSPPQKQTKKAAGAGSHQPHALTGL